MKILHLGKFYPPYRGGMESHLRTLCEEMVPDIDVDVIVSNDGKETVRETINGVCVERLASVARLASTSINPSMPARIRASRANLVHLHWPNPMAAVAYLLSRHKGPLVVTYHSDVVKQRLLGAAFTPVLRALLRRSRAILVSSPNYVETSKILREFRDRCHIVPFGVPETPSSGDDAEAIQAIRTQYGEQVILSVGRLVDYKGLDDLIQAMTMSPGRLVIAGDGPLKASLMNLTRRLALGNRVVFIGAPSDEHLRVLYRAADVFVLPSTDRREAFGLVQIEAMSAGKPVINTRLDSGVPFVSLDGITGLTVPPSDPGALAGAIARLMNDSELRRIQGHAAFKRAQTLFRADTMATRTMQIYDFILRPGQQSHEANFGRPRFPNPGPTAQNTKAILSLQ